eukprot:UN24827
MAGANIGFLTFVQKDTTTFFESPRFSLIVLQFAKIYSSRECSISNSCFIPRYIQDDFQMFMMFVFRMLSTFSKSIRGILATYFAAMILEITLSSTK